MLHRRGDRIGAEARIAPLKAEADFLIKLASAAGRAAAHQPGVPGFPNNSQAAVAPREYLERTVAVCREYGIALAYDNPYVEITFDGYRAPSIFEIEGAREVAVEFHSCSKSFTLTGWRLGWAIGNRELIAALTTIKSYHDTGPFLAVQYAGAVVLDQAEALTRAAVERSTCGATRAVRCADRGPLRGVPCPRATLYLWVPLPEGMKSADFALTALGGGGRGGHGGDSVSARGVKGTSRWRRGRRGVRLAEAAERMGRVLPQRRSFSLPAGSAGPRWWLVASVVVHFLVLGAMIESSMSWHLEHAGRLLALGAESRDSSRGRSCCTSRRPRGAATAKATARARSRAARRESRRR